MPVILALEKLKQEDQGQLKLPNKFQASQPGYIERH
jgi:hypothetical protein